jgi:hypothetical protein
MKPIDRKIVLWIVVPAAILGGIALCEPYLFGLLGHLYGVIILYPFYLMTITVPTTKPIFSWVTFVALCLINTALFVVYLPATFHYINTGIH